MVGNNVTYKHRTYIVQNWAKFTLPKLNNNQTRSVKKYEDDSLNQNPQIHRQHTYLNTPCLSFISSATDDLTKSRRRSILRKDALLNIIDIPEGTTGNERYRKKHLHTQTASPGILTGFSKGALSSRMGWLDLQKKNNSGITNNVLLRSTREVRKRYADFPHTEWWFGGGGRGRHLFFATTSGGFLYIS